MSTEAIGRRYARAIFEIGKETGTLPALSREISAFAETMSGNEELRQALDNPLVPEESRDAILKDLAERLGLSDNARNSLRLLAKNRRLLALPDVARQLAKLADEDQEMLRATVTSAGPLSEAYVAKLKAELERATGRKVTVTQQQDPSLIAGIVTRIGDQIIDGSARTRLQSFRESVLGSGGAQSA